MDKTTVKLDRLAMMEKNFINNKQNKASVVEVGNHFGSQRCIEVVAGETQFNHHEFSHIKGYFSTSQNIQLCPLHVKLD